MRRVSSRLANEPFCFLSSSSSSPSFPKRKENPQEAGQLWFSDRSSKRVDCSSVGNQSCYSVINILFLARLELDNQESPFSTSLLRFTLSNPILIIFNQLFLTSTLPYSTLQSPTSSILHLSPPLSIKSNPGSHNFFSSPKECLPSQDNHWQSRILSLTSSDLLQVNPIYRNQTDSREKRKQRRLAMTLTRGSRRITLEGERRLWENTRSSY